MNIANILKALGVIIIWFTLIHCKGSPDIDYEHCPQETHKVGYDKVNLTVFYAALCRNSNKFFKKHLIPTYKLLQSIINMELVPYGKTQKELHNGTWKFTCQRGPQQCEYNKIQACAIKLVKPECKCFEFISCLMTNKTKHFHKCTESLGKDQLVVNNCSTSCLGGHLLASLGDRTNEFMPPIRKFPTVAVNNVMYTEKGKTDSFKNLSKIICSNVQTKPKECSNL